MSDNSSPSTSPIPADIPAPSTADDPIAAAAAGSGDPAAIRLGRWIHPAISIPRVTPLPAESE